MTDINRSEINRALAKAIAYKQCGKQAEAEKWAETLVHLPWRGARAALRDRFPDVGSRSAHNRRNGLSKTQYRPFDRGVPRLAHDQGHVMGRCHRASALGPFPGQERVPDHTKRGDLPQ